MDKHNAVKIYSKRVVERDVTGDFFDLCGILLHILLP